MNLLVWGNMLIGYALSNNDRYLDIVSVEFIIIIILIYSYRISLHALVPNPLLQVLSECVHSILLNGLVGLDQVAERDRLDGHERTQPHPLIHRPRVCLDTTLFSNLLN